MGALPGFGTQGATPPAAPPAVKYNPLTPGASTNPNPYNVQGPTVPKYNPLQGMFGAKKGATAPGGPPAGAPPAVPGTTATAPGGNFRGAPPPPDYGSQSGPTAVEDRYNQRANGTDPGWEYATGRAQDQINRQYAARGGYNSSGAMNSIGDMYANATSQREGQLDTLSNEATSAHQNALNSMFQTGTGIANGVTNAGEQGAAGAGAQMTQDQKNQMDLYLAKIGVDQKTRQSIIDTGVAAGNIGAKVYGAK